VPLVGHGLLDATVDGRVARRWWNRWPEANIGMPTGVVSGFDVVDVDVRDTGSGYESFHRAPARFHTDGWVVRVVTPSGGTHFYYPADPERRQRNWVSGRAHVDFRGGGGAVILPPSAGVCGHGVRQSYTLAEARPGTGHPVDADGLRDFLDPGQARRRFPARLDRLPRPSVRDQALQEWVASRVEGERNAGLYWAACRMVEAGRPFDTAVDVLAGPAAQCGLAGREILVTIRSAYRHTRPTTTAMPDPPRPAGPDRRTVMAL
jgi:hypothetical protein